MERLHRLCRNVSKRMSATAASASREWKSGNQFKEVQSTVVSNVYWNASPMGEINEPKNGQDNHIKNFRVGCRTMRGAARTRSGPGKSVPHQHGPARSVPHGPQ